MKKKNILVNTLVLALAVQTAAPVTVQAFQIPDVIQDYIDQGTGDDNSEQGRSKEFSILEKAIVEIMKSDWYKNTDAEGRKKKIAELLASTGYIDEDLAEQGIDAVLNFEFHGQKISILLDDYTRDLYEQEEGEEYEQRDDITDSLDKERQALILYGLGFDEFEYALDYSTAKWNQNGLKTTMNPSCTVEDFKTSLKGKDLIVIEEHGCMSEQNEPVIVTEDQYDPDSCQEYQEDLDSERLAICIGEEGTQYCLTPSFFEYYYGGGQLQDSFVWIGSCYGASNSKLVDAFMDTGASAVVGHSESVYTMYDYNMLNTVVDGMISGTSSSVAFQEAKDQWGDNDEAFATEYMQLDYKDSPASYPNLTGDICWK